MYTINFRSRPYALSLLVLALFITVTLLPVSCTLQTKTPVLGKKATPAPDWPLVTENMRPDPNLSFGRLENGMRYVLMKNQTPKDRVSMHLMILAGSIHEKESERGLAHFLEHMQFNGSTHYPPGELVKYFQTIGMQFGPDANAHTGFDQTVYDILLPTGSPGQIDDALTVFLDYAKGALLLPEEIAREKKVVLAEKRSRDSASFRTFEKTLAFEFPDLRISKRLPIGLESVLNSVDREHMKAFYDAWYRPERMILVMVGDFDPNPVHSLIEARFRDMTPRKPEPILPDIGQINHRGVKTFYHHEPEAGNTSVGIGVYRKIEAQTDSSSLRGKELIRKIADRIVQNRLEKLTSYPKTPFTDAGIGSGVFLKQIAYAGIEAECRPDNWAQTLEKIEQELRQALTYGFTESELVRVKKEIMAELDDDAAKTATRKSGELATELLNQARANRVMQSPVQVRDRLQTAMDRLTPKKAWRAFQKTWDMDHRLVTVTGNATIPADSEKKPDANIAIKTVFENSRHAAVSPPVETAKVGFPYLAEPAGPGKIVSRNRITDPEIRQVTFENGVELFVMKTDFKTNQALLKANFGRGRFSEPKDQPGLSHIAEALVNESGLAQMDKETLARALAGTRAKLSFDIRENNFTYAGESASDEIPLLFQLLYAHFKDPGRRSSSLSIVKERYRQQYLSMVNSIDGTSRISTNKYLAGDDGRFGYPDLSRVDEYTLSHIRDWLAPAMEKAPLEIAVVGDVDEEEVIDMAGRYMGSLPVRDRNTITQPSRPDPRFPEGMSRETTVDTKIDTAMVVVAYPTDDRWDIHQTRRLSMLGEVFSERLRVQIRERLGAAYSPYAYNHGSRAYSGYGVFRIVVEVDPKRVEEVISTIREIASDLTARGITRDELDRALSPTLTGIKDHHRTNQYWLNTVLSGAGRRPEQIEWSRTIQKDYAAITVQDIRTTAKRFLIDSRAATLIITPASNTSMR